MRHVPLLFIPFIAYNLFAVLGLGGHLADEAAVFGIAMPSGATYTLSVGVVFVLVALVFLGIEVVKAARIGRGSIIDHVFATVLVIACLIEVMLVPRAATGTFVILMAIALLDLICGFAVSIRTASRDVSYGG